MTGESVGSARFVSHVEPALVSSGVARVSVALSLPDEDFSRTLDLDNVGGEWTGTMEGIPAGEGRTFTAEAFGADGTKLFVGKATGVTITAGQTALVSILLQEVPPPPPFDNAVPVIDSLVASASSVAPGGTLTLTASAHDPNAGDSLTYAWTGTDGTFASPASATTTWTAPMTTGRVSLTVTVTDSQGAVAAMTVSIPVRTPSSGTGGADIDVSFNTWPRVARITASPSRVKPGEPTAVQVSASDVDGDSLAYQWSASGCTGTWVDGGSASARFTPDAVPATGACDCRLHVTVEDGRGGQGQGTLAICVGESPSLSFPPRIVMLSLVEPEGGPVSPVMLGVEAEDPQGSALDFTWVANTGTLGTAVSKASSSEVTWTAPACLTSGTPTVTVTVRNALGLSTSHAFTIPGLPDCSPPHDSWSAVGALSFGRRAHTATVLPSGRVLVVAGTMMGGFPQVTAEVYDPVTGLSLPTSLLNRSHAFHTATRLPSGKVLVAGGAFDALAELYDPESNTWTLTGPMSVVRSGHTATLLYSGKVLVVGGHTASGTALASAELYDPESNTWSPASSSFVSHQGHTATVLPSGQVLVAGGDNAVAELFDPASGKWSLTGALGSSRTGHAAVLLGSGQVLVAGGANGSGALATAELYNPASGTWLPTGSMRAPHAPVPAMPLGSGQVLVAGGGSDMAELYDPGTGAWTALPRMDHVRQDSVLVRVRSGRVLVLGGDEYVSVVEVFDPATASWIPTGSGMERVGLTLTQLPSGKLLVVGGQDLNDNGLDLVDVYDPATRTWSAAAPLLGARYGHTATLLPSGKVLVAGGAATRSHTLLNTVELYDPVSGKWSAAAPMGQPRAGTATLLPSGKVLMVGGDWTGLPPTAELYDPATDTWSPVAAPLSEHGSHTATLLPSGKVLVVGGRFKNDGADAVAELYDPATDTWTPSTPLAAHIYHTATMLPSGRVLVVGGPDKSRVAELYDPASGTWSPVANPRSTRLEHTATLLPSGKVLVVGGLAFTEPSTYEDTRADLYDPVTDTWSELGFISMLASRVGHEAQLLSSGQVLVVGGPFGRYSLGLLYTP